MTMTHFHTAGIHKFIAANTRSWCCGAGNVNIELSHRDRHEVSGCDVLHHPLVPLQVVPKERGQHPRDKLIAVQITVVVWVSATKVYHATGWKKRVKIAVKAGKIFFQSLLHFFVLWFALTRTDVKKRLFHFNALLSVH